MKKMIILCFILCISQSLFADTSFYYYKKDHRIQVIERLYEATKNRYALWDLKKINMQINGDELFTQAILAERGIDDVEGPVLKAKSNIEFHSRIKKLIASFQDTHFSGHENVRLPMMINGIKVSVATIDSKEVPVVTAVSKKIVEFNQAIGGEGQYQRISLGDQVVAVDGRPIDEKIAEISNYIAGSSSGFIKSSAMGNLMARNFLYADKNFAQWTFRTSAGNEYSVRLPWYVEKTNRTDAQVYFRSHGIRFLDDIYYSWDDKNLTWIESRDLRFDGFSRFDAPRGLLNIVEWYADDSLNLRTGLFIKNGKSYGYAQLFSYTNSQHHLKNMPDKLEGRSHEILRNFILELKASRTPLIFDLRVNFGGNTEIAVENLSSLARTGDSYPSRTIAYRTSQFMQSMFGSIDYDPSLADQTSFYNFDVVLEEFFHAVSIGREYTNVMLQTRPIVAADEVGGYDLPVVALISPWCISACDNQAFLLQHSNRVTLIGSPANGTGAGFQGDSSHSSTFVDPLNIVSVGIPNYLFGLPVVSDNLVIEDLDGSILARTNSENKPTMPTIPFNYTVESYQNKSSDWIDFAINNMEQRPVVSNLVQN